MSMAPRSLLDKAACTRGKILDFYAHAGNFLLNELHLLAVNTRLIFKFLTSAFSNIHKLFHTTERYSDTTDHTVYVVDKKHKNYYSVLAILKQQL